MNTRLIQESITHSPTAIQIAKNDNWENCYIIPALLSLPHPQKIQSYLDESPYEYVSAELVFKEADGNFILGLDHDPKRTKTTATEFLQSLVLLTKNYRSFGDFIERIGKVIPENMQMFSGDPDVVRIGIVNHWLSEGICTVWRKNQEKYIALSMLQQIFQENQKLLKTNLNYQGMSFVFNLNGENSGLCHWIKSPCSTFKNDYWILDPDKITLYLQRWLDINIV